jgi:hypothetical protein
MRSKCVEDALSFITDSKYISIKIRHDSGGRKRDFEGRGFGGGL